jgi:hypothetical protein
MAKASKPAEQTSTGRKVLPADVAAIYEPAPGVLAQFVCSEFGHVDLSVVTLEFAERLARAGFLKNIVSE